jgi:F-type H+-transporting ATPase subunit delta
MSVETIARRYAAALADVVTSSGDTAAVKSELKTWDELISSNAELQSAFSSPAVPQAKKSGVLEGLIDRTKPTKTTANFLRVLLQNNRLTDLAAINERFDSVIEERGGAMQAFVASAHELSEDQKAELRTNVEKLTGKKATLNFSIDSDLIGGVVTRIGSTVYDGSVRTQLENLREKLING